MIINDKCTICQGWHFVHQLDHVCPPLWEVCDPECEYEEGYEWDHIYALDAATAAELFCERWDRRDHDYPYVKAEQSEILVRGHGTGVVQRMTVTAYNLPTYNATPSLVVREDD